MAGQKKKEKKRKKAEKKEIKRKKKALKALSKKAVPYADLTGKAQSLIDRVIEDQEAVTVAKERIQTNLEKLTQEMGGSTFLHPTLGEWTVVFRKGKYYWRPKPMRKD